MGEILEALQFLRLEHRECEDSWYSCPRSGECSDDRQGDECTCCADGHNAALDLIIERIKTKWTK